MNTPRRVVRVVCSSAIPCGILARSFVHRNCILDPATMFSYFLSSKNARILGRLFSKIRLRALIQSPIYTAPRDSRRRRSLFQR